MFEIKGSDETVQQDQHYYLRVGSFFEPLSKSQTLIRLTYPSSVCYLLNAQDHWYCLSFCKGVAGLEQFDKDLGFFMNILDYNSELLDPSVRQDIKKHCPDTIGTQDVSSDAKRMIRKIGSTIGLIAGKASTIFHNPTAESTMSVLSQRANRFS